MQPGLTLSTDKHVNKSCSSSYNVKTQQHGAIQHQVHKLRIRIFVVITASFQMQQKIAYTIYHSKYDHICRKNWKAVNHASSAVNCVVNSTVPTQTSLKHLHSALSRTTQYAFLDLKWTCNIKETIWQNNRKIFLRIEPISSFAFASWQQIKLVRWLRQHLVAIPAEWTDLSMLNDLRSVTTEIN